MLLPLVVVSDITKINFNILRDKVHPTLDIASPLIMRNNDSATLFISIQPAVIIIKTNIYQYLTILLTKIICDQTVCVKLMMN